MPEIHIDIDFGEASKKARDLIDTEQNGKQAKSDAEYRDAENKHVECRNCENWMGNDQALEAACKKVGGEVEAAATCRLNDPRDPGVEDEDEGGEPGDEPVEAPAKEVPPFGGVSKKGPNDDGSE